METLQVFQKQARTIYSSSHRLKQIDNIDHISLLIKFLKWLAVAVWNRRARCNFEGPLSLHSQSLLSLICNQNFWLFLCSCLAGAVGAHNKIIIQMISSYLYECERRWQLILRLIPQFVAAANKSYCHNGLLSN